MKAKPKRINCSYKFTEEGKLLLQGVAKKDGISETAVLEQLIREKAERRGVTLSYLNVVSS